MDIQKGYLFISDISGYTQFLTQSELDHAKEILDALFDSILHHLNPPIVISARRATPSSVISPQTPLSSPGPSWRRWSISTSTSNTSSR